MRPAPPKAAEFVLAILIPPACREEVLGDLHERYTSLAQYLADALRTAPLVIASRIIRTLDAQLSFMQACVLYLSFLAAARFLDSPFLYTEDGLVRLAIPAVAALVALTLWDAYAKPGSPPRPVLSAALALACAFVFQAVLTATHLDSALPRWIMLFGAAMSLVLVSTLRIMFSAGPDRRLSAGAPAPVPESPQPAFPLKTIAVTAALATILIIAYELDK